MNATFQALAEEKRRGIVELLARHGQMTATAIAKKFEVTPPAISQHLKVLRQARLVTVQKQAQKRIYRINPDTMQELEHWAQKLTGMWKGRFDRLDALLAKEKNKIFVNYNEEFHNKRKKY